MRTWAALIFACLAVFLLAACGGTSSAVSTDCTASMEYIADVTIPDNTVVKPGERFVKTWRVKNDGTCPWDGYRLTLVQGDAMTDANQPVPKVQPGEEVELSIPMTAPADAGSYAASWQMETRSAEGFGQLIVSIQVEP